MGLRGARIEQAYVDEAQVAPAGEAAMEQSKGWRNLPLKEQGLARAIVAGFAAELELDRRLRGIS